MKIAVIAPARHPIVEPYAGGLEAFCGLLVDHLRRRGHHVDLYAARGSHGHVAEYEFPGVDWRGLDAFASDVAYPPGQREAEDEAFRRLRHHLEASDYDVVHNNSLHPELLRSRILPLLTTLHCPPLAEMEEALADSTSALTAVSRATADSWNVPGPVAVLPNGVDGDIWRPPAPGPSASTSSGSVGWSRRKGRTSPSTPAAARDCACWWSAAAAIPLTGTRNWSRAPATTCVSCRPNGTATSPGWSAPRRSPPSRRCGMNLSGS